MASEKLRNRWGIAGAAVVMQIYLGAVYGWSGCVKLLIATENWELTDFSLVMLVSLILPIIARRPVRPRLGLLATPRARRRLSGI